MYLLEMFKLKISKNDFHMVCLKGSSFFSTAKARKTYAIKYMRYTIDSYFLQTCYLYKCIDFFHKNVSAVF